MTETLRFERPQGDAFEAKLGAVLGQGGNGRVLEAAPVAPLRGLPESLVVKHSTKSADRMVELEREACERLDHPSLVRYFGRARSRELGTVLAFERLAPNPHLLLNGDRYRPRFRDPGTTYYPLPPGRALELAFDLLLGLEYVHARGYVHADVKLANLLVRTPAGTSDQKGVLARVSEGAFEGVLIDLGSLRSLEALEALSKGEADPELLPRVTPLYAPPEVLFERGELGGKKVFSPAMDSYAFGLVLYVLLTGRVPYGHIVGWNDLQRPEPVIELKLRESRGEISPLDPYALDALPLHDVAFEGDPRREWPSFRAAAQFLLRRCLEPDPRTRLDVSGARVFFEEEFRMRPSGTSASRPWTQGLFQMRPRCNRILGDEPGRTITIREDKGQVVVLEGARPVADETITASVGPPIMLEDGSTLRFKKTKSRSSTLKKSAVPPPPKNMVYLASVLREYKAGRKLPVSCPVLVTRTGFSPRELVRSLLFPLDAACGKVRIREDGTLQEQRRAVVGRTDDADVVVQDKLVSKRHCVLERRPDGWWVEDLSSANGTFVQDVVVEPGKPVRLKSPIATITLGPTSKLTLMEEEAFLPFLEQALEAWRQAFGRGNTGQLARQGIGEATPHEQTKSGRIVPVPADFEGSKTRVEEPDDASTESSPPRPFTQNDTDTTKRVSVSRLREILSGKVPAAAEPAASGIPAEVGARIKELGAQNATFEIILEGAQVESPDDTAEALAVVKKDGAHILCIDARLVTGERIVLFQRDRKP